MTAPLSAPVNGIRLWKAHGLGNDYLVLESGPRVSADLVRALCDRHRGVGGDGLLEPIPVAAGAAGGAFGVRIWNPDGSVAERSGNGLRIFARWLVGSRGAPRDLAVDTGFGVVRCRVGDETVEVAMGRARFGLVEARLQGFPHPVVTLSVGNPHCVVFRDRGHRLDDLPWRDWGRALERHPAFPDRTNVQVARVVDPAAIEVRVWERGAGETSASGSSACAVVAAAVHTGRAHVGRVAVHMPGGVLEVTVSSDGELTLAGPVEGVGTVIMDPPWLEDRGY